MVLLFVTACQFYPSSQKFSANNLLSLDPSDSTRAQTDILALYSFQSDATITFRVDLLDFSTENAPALSVLLDTFPGSIITPPKSIAVEDQWDTIIHIRPDLTFELEGDFNQPLIWERVDVSYDPELDFVEVSLPRQIVRPPGPFEIVIASLDPVDSTIADIVGPVLSDARPPEPIPILLSFSNVFPAETPAQSMRSWDGAHNGPAGERFGLRHLLDAVENYGVPIMLADIKQQSSLMGLQILGANAWIQELERQALLSLPDTIPQSLCEQASAMGWPGVFMERIGAEAMTLGYSASSALTCTYSTGFTDSVVMPTGYRTILLSPSEAASDQDYQVLIENAGFIPLHDGSSISSLSIDGGLSLDLRRQLVTSLDPTQPESVLILSADFQRSFWGDPHSANDSIRWIAWHPWIRPITLDTLSKMDLPLRNPKSGIFEVESPTSDNPFTPSRITLSEVLPFLRSARSMGLRSFAWYLLNKSHTTPACTTQANTIGSVLDTSTACETLQEKIRRGLEHLSSVWWWEQTRFSGLSEDQYVSSESSLESQSDGIMNVEDRWLSIVSPSSHTLEAIFITHPQEGSIPLIWNPISSSLYGSEDLDINVEAAAAANRLEIEFQSDLPGASVQLPIYLPLDREQECLKLDEAVASIVIGCLDGIELRMDIRDGIWKFDSVLDTPARWNLVEDPNQEMPEGHFLSIPFGLLTIDFDDRFSLELTVIG